MAIAYVVVTALFALMSAFSAVLKLRQDPKIVKVIHEMVGVPMKYLPLLAACEIAGALGLVVGYWYPPLGLAAAIGLVIYFVGAVVSHIRVGDFKGVGNASFMLGLAVAALLLRTVRM
jgi:uncharacterized membrane protein YphA (DoxX/SURF4 family)